MGANFRQNEIIDVCLVVQTLANEALSLFADITKAKDICIAGGFARGLYMQQFLGLSPQMNDIDVFAEISVEKFNTIKERVEAEFGIPVRFHVGQFEREERARGLIEFSLPEHLRNSCADVESIQLNFGERHPWANPYEYVTKANVGMNQIAILQSGRVIASKCFLDDMNNKTMTMNPCRIWTAHDWIRTTKSLERMRKEKPEFQGWQCIPAPRPYVPSTGKFWDAQEHGFAELTRRVPD